MYPNLNAELARRNITKTKLAELTGIRYGTLVLKMRGEGTFSMKEAVLIRDAISADLTLDYLFDAELLEAVK